jgi:hypothetical protein
VPKVNISFVSATSHTPCTKCVWWKIQLNEDTLSLWCEKCISVHLYYWIFKNSHAVKFETWILNFFESTDDCKQFFPTRKLSRVNRELYSVLKGWKDAAHVARYCATCVQKRLKTTNGIPLAWRNMACCYNSACSLHRISRFINWPSSKNVVHFCL